MKPNFLRMRRKWRAVLIIPSPLADLVSPLRGKNFYNIVLPDAPLDQHQKEWWLPGRTLVTDKPNELNVDDVPSLEFSLIDISMVKEKDAAAIADMISLAWTKLRLKTEGWFVLRMHHDGKHEIEFPE